MALFGTLILIAALGDLAYPDVLSCYSSQTVEDRAVFCVVEEEKREAPSGEVAAQVKLWGALSVKNVRVRYYEKGSLIPGGNAFGVKLSTKGLLVTGTESFLSRGERVEPAASAGIGQGDRILSIDGVRLEKSSQLVRLVEKSEGAPMEFVLFRDGKETSVRLTPRLCDEEGKYRAGLWVKDSTAGIGTLTYIDPESLRFAGLGHGITDPSGKEIAPMASGEVWQVKIDGIEKGKAGDPGELKGSFVGKKIGELVQNTLTGVYGSLSEKPQELSEPLPIALKGELTAGAATIRCTLDESGVKEYAVEIERIHSPDTPTKNFVIRVTDPELLERTGGIVQGMSGSPIIQDGKLVGAVTHVLVNDPTRGYGIFLENMLAAQEKPIPKAA